jgi:hypothetical protein
MLCEVWARLQFNIVLDNGFQGWWQLNDVLVIRGENREVQFNDMLVGQVERGLLWAEYRNG